MAKNLVTFGQSQAAVTARNAEYLGTPLTDVPGTGTYADPYLGMNRAGSCAPGIGINTGSIFQTAAELAAGERFESWTELDQTTVPVARIPQDTQHIGGIINTSPPYAGVPYPTPAQSGDQPTQIADILAVDFNNTANFVIVDTAVGEDQVMDITSGTVNNTGGLVAIGDLVWGQVKII